MTGRLYIDGNDIYTQFGMYVVQDGWKALVAMPPLKAVTANDWQEEDGIEADLENPVLNSREFQINFAVSSVYNRYNAFVEMLSDGAYHEFDCAILSRKYTLRMVAQPRLDYAETLGFVAIKFADDFPLKGYKYKSPSCRMIPANDYKFDGHCFTDYGARVLQGSLSEVMKLPDVKKNLLRNIKTLSGATYDDKQVTFKSKDVKLKFLMRAESLEELWQNYDALLYDLTRPEERSLWVNQVEQSFPFFYKSCTVTRFFPKDKIWLEFTLTLTFTRSFRIGEDDVLLASEDNILIITENGVYAVDLMPDKFSYPPMRFVNDKQTIRLMANGNIRFND